MTARMIDLAALICPGEPRWLGQIQLAANRRLTANRRLIAHIVKHSLVDRSGTGTVQCLDSFLADATHYSLLRWMRLRLSELLRSRRHAAR